MTFVITQGCCDDASCVPVCPVQCIRPRPGDPGFTTTEQLYIDPSTCIECGNCAFACPVDAIFHEADLPPSQVDFRGINADYFAAHPLEDLTPHPIERRRLPRARPELSVAIVGAGPSALYAAAELSDIRGVTVMILERTPTAHGLVRAGVAPDHDRTKLIGERFDRVLRRPNVTALFNVDVGRDVSVQELLRHHHAVVWAAGASDDRTMGIPGEGRVGLVSAREFVSWYNGHPDFAEREFDLSGRRAVVIGNGNVALDVARVLAQPVGAFEKTSMSDLALAALRASNIREVVVVGRRGQAFAAYSTAELLALSQLPGVDLLADPTEVSVTEQELETSRGRSADLARRRAIVDAAARRTPGSPRRIVLRYRLTPTELPGDHAVSGVALARPDGTAEMLDTSLVIRAVGFRGRAAPGLPFDSSAGIVPNDGGRVVDPETGRPLPGLYCTGWIKRGPTGVIGTNRADSAETVASLLDDVADHRLPEPPHGPPQLIKALRRRQPNLIDAMGWWRIDEAEKRAGRASGRPRVKLLAADDLLRAAREDHER
ncbi:FAD-dependent oxidoreductase [Blastococcus saxobsidens]|uniref:ferredoxin--NADP(+) reductase n=1 Tax=Blastococcus saxobsidens TaxID=138336 RepID=A0A6L9W683_9ACTN|nr:FAD-dependent oxidoreductase [Blastococcus saxobsidens]